MASKRNPPRIDNFRRIRVINRNVESLLHEAGVLTFAKLARMTPEEILKLIGDLPGVTIARIVKQDWIGQARELAGRKSVPSSDEPEDGPVQESLATHGLSSFVVELLTEPEGDVARTKVMHVATGLEDAWTGWREKRLLDFLVRQSGLKLPETVEAVEAEAAAPEGTESAPALAPIVEETAQLETIVPEPAPLAERRIAEVLPPEENPMIVVDADLPFHLRAGQAIDLRLTLDLTTAESLRGRALHYQAILYARSLDGRFDQTIGRLQGSNATAEKIALALRGSSLPRGFYRLETVVTVMTPSTKSKPRIELAPHLVRRVVYVGSR